jgi:hypothetical protein
MSRSNHKKNRSGDLTALAEKLVNSGDQTQLRLFLLQGHEDSVEDALKMVAEPQRTYFRVVQKVVETLEKDASDYAKTAKPDGTKYLDEHQDLTERVTFVEDSTTVECLDVLKILPLDEETASGILDVVYNLGAPIVVLPNIPSYTQVTLFKNGVSAYTS